jgi:hypothetical protein
MGRAMQSGYEEPARRIADPMKRRLKPFCPLSSRSLTSWTSQRLWRGNCRTDSRQCTWRRPQTMRSHYDCQCYLLWRRHSLVALRCTRSVVRTTRVGRGSAITAESSISTAATTLRAAVTREHPVLESEWSIGCARFEAMIPPVVSAPTFAIRLKRVRVFGLDDYVSTGIMSARQRAVISDAVARRRNILICGGTASGKTTLGNAVLAATVGATPNDRPVILEDTVELQCRARNVVALLATDTVKMQRLLRATGGDAARFSAAEPPGKRPPLVDKVMRRGAP